MWLDRLSNPGPLALGLDAPPTAPRGPVFIFMPVSILEWEQEILNKNNLLQ